MSVAGAHDKIGNALLKQNDLEGALSRVYKAHERLVVTVAGVAGNVADNVEEAPDAP